MSSLQNGSGDCTPGAASLTPPKQPVNHDRQSSKCQICRTLLQFVLPGQNVCWSCMSHRFDQIPARVRALEQSVPSSSERSSQQVPSTDPKAAAVPGKTPKEKLDMQLSVLPGLLGAVQMPEFYRVNPIACLTTMVERLAEYESEHKKQLRKISEYDDDISQASKRYHRWVEQVESIAPGTVEKIVSENKKDG